LEILVVDDGSRDGTRDLAEQFARRDPRIRVLSQANGGVARARNLGITEAKAEYVAPVDADDLWHATKIEKQLAVMRASPASTAFVYCSFRVIDEDDRVIGQAPAYRLRGRVINRHVLVNFVGNGSALFMRRSAVLACGGYDTSLRDQGLQGAEDFLLQLQLASRYPVDVVPEYLVGYRRTQGAMSENVERMALSYITAHKKVQAQCGYVPRWAFGCGAAPYMAGCALRAARRGQVLQSLKLLLRGMRMDVAGTVDQVATMVWDKTPSLDALARGLPIVATRRGPPARRPEPPLFFDLRPTDSMVLEPGWLLERRLKRLEPYDAGWHPDAEPPSGFFNELDGTRGES
jgi:hypothetical protein